MRLAARTRIVPALGVIQIIAWGSTYYLMAVVARPISAETGWNAGMLSAGVSCGLLAAGLAAPTVGRRIQATGGRQVLAGGMALIATGLLLLGSAQSLWLYFAAWTVLGLGMAAGLYDAAFSTLGRLFGRDARVAITRLTLWGGFASTICWPITAWLVEAVGWRGACFAWAALHATVTLPMSLLLPRQPPVAEQSPRTGTASADRLRFLDLRYLCIAVAGVTLSMLATIWSIHLVAILTAMGYSMATAIALGTLIGPAQVGARVLEMLGRGRHHPIWTMGASTGLTLLGFVGLSFGLPAAAALVAYGAGNGLWSIARGALPLTLFGPVHYAPMMGRLARPMLISGAAAPVVGALLIERAGAAGTLAVLSLAAVVPCVAALVLAAWLRRQGRPYAL